MNGWCFILVWGFDRLDEKTIASQSRERVDVVVSSGHDVEACSKPVFNACQDYNLK